jgi:hypothetical protein
MSEARTGLYEPLPNESYMNPVAMSLLDEDFEFLNFQIPPTLAWRVSQVHEALVFEYFFKVLYSVQST